MNFKPNKNLRLDTTAFSAFPLISFEITSTASSGGQYKVSKHPGDADTISLFAPALTVYKFFQ